MNYIKLNGTDYPIQFGMSLMKQLSSKYKLPKISQADELISNIQWDDISWILYGGIETAHTVMGKPCPITEQQCDEWVELDVSLMTTVSDVLLSQLAPESKEDEDKQGPGPGKQEPKFKK